MRKIDNTIRLILLCCTLVFLQACGDDEIPQNSPTPQQPDQTAPGLSSLTITPANATFGDTVTVSGTFSDDEGLGQIDINVIDQVPSLLLDTTINLSGTEQTISFDLIIPFRSTSRGGQVLIEAIVTDAAGNTTLDENQAFAIARPTIDAMYLHTNGTATAMTGTGANGWELTVDLANAQEYRFATTADSSGFVWGANPDVPGAALLNSAANFVNEDVSSSFVVNFNDSTFEVGTALATFDEIYLLGNFNGWGNGRPEDLMTKVGDHDWIITTDFSGPDNVPITDVLFKFVDANNFGGIDWGDNGADGIADRGGDNISPGVDVTPVTIEFNDLTGVYSVSTIAKNFAELFVLGAHNGWGNGGPEDAFDLIDNNTWRTTIVFTEDNQEFKIVDGPNFGGADFGDDENDGIANPGPGGGNIAPGLPTGTYVFTFNDASLAYYFSTVNHNDIYILGAHQGWGNGQPEDRMRVVGPSNWQLEVTFTGDSDEFKFVDGPDFGGADWGDNEPDGVADPGPGGSNIGLPGPAGTYTVTFDDATLQYTINQ